jgi:hypothetical protein
VHLARTVFFLESASSILRGTQLGFDVAYQTCHLFLGALQIFDLLGLGVDVGELLSNDRGFLSKIASEPLDVLVVFCLLLFKGGALLLCELVDDSS